VPCLLYTCGNSPFIDWMDPSVIPHEILTRKFFLLLLELEPWPFNTVTSLFINSAITAYVSFLKTFLLCNYLSISLVFSLICVHFLCFPVPITLDDILQSASNPISTIVVVSFLLQKKEEEHAYLFQYGITSGLWEFREELAKFLSARYGETVHRYINLR
jgi:hypothetical protein